MSEGQDPAELHVSDTRAPIWAKISVVWLVPLLALGISLFIAWQNYSNRGVPVVIQFTDAAGIEEGKTLVKFRDVKVGHVEKITFADDLSHVKVTALIDQSVAAFVDADAQFWVTRPRVTTRGITGIETIVGGVHIEGSWNTDPGEEARVFRGLEEAPFVPVGTEGTHIQLRAEDAGSLAAGSPILYKRIDVGQIDKIELADDGDHVLVSAFVRAPHDRRLTTATRFWNVSGFTLSLDAGGVELDVDSLASLVEGGIEFETVYSGGTPIADGHLFEMYDDRASARESIFNRRLASEVRLSVEFTDSVRGLAAGAEVTYRGVRVGQVETLTAIVQEGMDGELSDARLLTNISISPGRLGLPDSASPEETLQFLADSVANGLRAQIASANILTGALHVELVELPEARPATLDTEAQPFPLLPSVESEIADLAANADGIISRVNNLPVEELMSSAIDLMHSMERLVSDQAAQGTPEAIVALLEDTRALVNSDEVQAIPKGLNKSLREVNAMLDEINQGAAIANLVATLGEARATAEAINASTEALPALLANLDALTASLAAVPYTDLASDAGRTLRSAEDFLNSEHARAIPAEAAALLSDLRALIASPPLQQAPADLQNALARVNALLESFEEMGAVDGLGAAIKSAERAARSIETASADLPDLLANVEALAETAAALPLDQLIASATGLVETADGLIGSDEAKALPPALTATLAEIERLLATLREGDAAANLNTALSSAATASDAIALAVQDLPALSQRLTRLADQAGATLGAYGGSSEFNYQTRSALREIQGAAEAVASLARAIERRPNSILTGR